MKRIYSIAIIAIFLISCKKENLNIKTDAVAQVNTEKPVYKTIFIQKQPLQEISVADAENIVGLHDNDTLYITNLFATWCGPCMREIPHFKEKMQELKNHPVKWTFISLDEKTDWQTDVKKFAEENGLSNNIVLLDGSTLPPDFFTKNFKSYDGSGIPFTFMQKRDKTDEYMSMMTKEQLDQKIASFGISTSVEQKKSK